MGGDASIEKMKDILAHLVRIRELFEQAWERIEADMRPTAIEQDLGY